MLEEIRAATTQIVQHGDIMSGAHEAIDKIGANKAGAAGDDDVHRASQFASDFVPRNHGPKILTTSLQTCGDKSGMLPYNAARIFGCPDFAIIRRKHMTWPLDNRSFPIHDRLSRSARHQGIRNTNNANFTTEACFPIRLRDRNVSMAEVWYALSRAAPLNPWKH